MKSIAERFWSKVIKKSDDECWEWTGSKLRGGYGSIKVWDRAMQAHRLSYDLFRGPLPKDKDVLHSCDNPSCVNPNHLFLGDDISSSKDRVNKGRQARGIHAKSKLVDNEVLEIRRYAELGLSRKFISRMFRVGKTCVTYIVNRRTWKHI